MSAFYSSPARALSSARMRSRIAGTRMIWSTDTPSASASRTKVRTPGSRSPLNTREMSAGERPTRSARRCRSPRSSPERAKERSRGGGALPEPAQLEHGGEPSRRFEVEVAEVAEAALVGRVLGPRRIRPRRNMRPAEMFSAALSAPVSGSGTGVSVIIAGEYSARKMLRGSKDREMMREHMAGRTRGSGRRTRTSSSGGGGAGSGLLSLIGPGPNGSQVGDPGAGSVPAGAGPSTGEKVYDEGEFLVGGKSTGEGDVIKVSFNVHEGYIAEAMRWLHSGLFPYEYLSDVLRHAFVRHVGEFLPSLEKLMEGSIAHQLNLIAEIVAREKFNLMFIASIDNIAAIISRIIELPGGKRQAGKMLRRMRRQIERMDEDFYKSYYERMFSNRFGPYEQSGLVLLDGGAGDEGEGEQGAEDEGEEESAELEEIMRGLRESGGGMADESALEVLEMLRVDDEGEEG